MTRINVIHPEELCDQHLLAEYREITRIPSGLAGGKLRLSYADAPARYTLGAGHIKFFVDKLGWLRARHLLLVAECRARGFDVRPWWPLASLGGEWQPDDAAVALNRARILDRMPTVARWTSRARPGWAS